MNSCRILGWTLLLTVIAHSIASIETETKYTIITQPGDVVSSTSISKPIDEEYVSTTDVTKDSTSSRIESDEDLEESISINVLQNGKQTLE